MLNKYQYGKLRKVLETINFIKEVSGDHDWARTNDFFHVKEVLYQLSYAILFKYRHKS